MSKGGGGSVMLNRGLSCVCVGVSVMLKGGFSCLRGGGGGLSC